MRRNSTRQRTTVKEDQQKNVKLSSSLTEFERSMLFMNIVKQYEKQIFQQRQRQLNTDLELLSNQNKLMEKLEVLKKTQKPKETGESSIKVLEELDLNRKQAHEALEHENKNLVERIEELELTLRTLQKLQKSSNLCPEYLNKLESKIKKRQKLNTLMSQKIEQLTNENSSKIKQFRDLWGNQIIISEQILMMLKN